MCSPDESQPDPGYADIFTGPVRKIMLTPGLIATCNSCGRPSSTRYPSWLTAMLPGSILMLAAMFISSELVALALNIFALIMIIIIPLWFAPLYKEEQQD